MADFPHLQGLQAYGDDMFTIAIITMIILLMDDAPRQQRLGSYLGRRQLRNRARIGFDACLNEQLNFRAFFELSYKLWDSDRDEFRELFRMEKSTFDKLANVLTPFLPRPRRRSRPDSISPRERLFLALVWLGNGGNFSMICKNTGRAATTFSVSVDIVANAVIEALAAEVRLPSSAEVLASTTWFRDNTGMLGCIGG